MLALSATYPKSLGDNLDFYMKNPMHVKINPNDVSLFGLFFFVIAVISPINRQRIIAKVSVLLRKIRPLPMFRILNSEYSSI